MEHIALTEMIDLLERGTKVHITVAFLDNCGNRKTRCTHSQSVHDRPVCLAVKQTHRGLASCYRCRNTVQKAVIRRQKPMAGLCTNGVYEYCKPVVYDGRVICVIFVGNILTDDPRQRNTLTATVGNALLDTMEQDLTPGDCARLADALESYIHFLFDCYGIESKTFDPLIENIKGFVRENMAYDFSMAELSAAFNYTPKYLGRVFKLRTGQTVQSFCNQLRVSRAKYMLSETDLEIERIALQTGFNSIQYFDRVFHRITGLSPQKYRSGTKKHSGRK